METMTPVKGESTEVSLRMFSSRMWWTVLGTLVVASAATRFYKLDQPASVCWDETHWGKFAGNYLNRTFFFENNPPLGVMLIALFGYMDGYQANIPFLKPGEKFLDDSYMGMRMGCTSMGAMVVPLSFLIVWEMTFSLPASTLAACLILCDHGLLTLSRFILLDAGLLCFICMSVYATVKFHNLRDQSFSAAWWFWLFTLGVMLTATITHKFVGVLTILLVGLRTITDLWTILGDLSRPVSYTVKNFLARVLCLIVVPAVLYMAVYYVHLKVLKRTGNGDYAFSSAFQTGLEGNPLHGAVPQDVVYSSAVTLKNDVVAGNLLHSHELKYPENHLHQQTTTYPYKDIFNKFIIKKHDHGQFFSKFNMSDPVQPIRNGDFVRLLHGYTGRHLFSYLHPAPVTEMHFQVSTFGDDAIVHPNEFWQLVIENAKEEETLRTLNQRFQLVHKVLKCALTTSDAKLPLWGFNQYEVTCNRNIRDSRSFWIIESQSHPRVPKDEKSNDTPFGLSFLQQFVEVHQVMTHSNARMKPTSYEFLFRPIMWPFNAKGLFFSAAEDHSVYLLGNPIIWWGNIVSTDIFLLLLIVHFVKVKRGSIFSQRQLMLQRRVINSCGWLYIGWLLHYVPFWLIGRVIYYHHYFPAVLFSSMLSGVILDYLIESLHSTLSMSKSMSKLSYCFLFVLVIYTIIYSFYLFAPLTYGFKRPKKGNSSMHHLSWIPSWEF